MELGLKTQEPSSGGCGLTHHLAPRGLGRAMTRQDGQVSTPQSREQGLQSWSEPVFPYPKVPSHILSGGYTSTFNFRNDYAEKEAYYRG